MSYEVVCFQMLDNGTSNLRSLEIKFVETNLFLENYHTSEVVDSHNGLYYQQLSNTH